MYGKLPVPGQLNQHYKNSETEETTLESHMWYKASLKLLFRGKEIRIAVPYYLTLLCRGSAKWCSYTFQEVGLITGLFLLK